LTNDDIRVDRAYINKSIHGGTKSQSGNRVVPLVGEFASFPKSPKTLRKVLDPHGIHIHSLRHTYAYILKSQGIHVTTAQKLMGHSDPKLLWRFTPEFWITRLKVPARFFGGWLINLSIRDWQAREALNGAQCKKPLVQLLSIH